MRTRDQKIVRSAFAVAALLAFGACGDATGIDAIDDVVVRDMALVAADATLEEVNAWVLPFGFGSVGAQAVPGLGGFGNAAGRPGGRHGLGQAGSGTVEKRFFDAAGTEQNAYDPETTDRIEVLTEIGGEVTRENWSATVYHLRQMTVTGLAGKETTRTFNGSGSSEVSKSRHTDEGDRSYDMSGSSTYTDVVIPAPGSDTKYPLSGTIQRSMTSTRTTGDGTETRSMEMTITFDGDATATAVVNGETMEIDLSTKDGRRPFRGKKDKAGG